MFTDFEMHVGRCLNEYTFITFLIFFFASYLESYPFKMFFSFPLIKSWFDEEAWSSDLSDSSDSSFEFSLLFFLIVGNLNLKGSGYK